MWGGARAAGAEQALRTGPAYHVGVLRSTPPPSPRERALEPGTRRSLGHRRWVRVRVRVRAGGRGPRGNGWMSRDNCRQRKPSRK